jgi:uncharacterized protein YgiB involved in biofilm formation
VKRSEYIALGAVGLLAVATLWPRGSGEQAHDPAVAAGSQEGFQTLAFANLAECKDSQAVTALTCENEYAKASQQSVEDAPKFQALSDCEAEYGASQCRPATWNGASVFIPALAGVLIARSLANAAQTTSQPLYPPRTGPAACPPGYNPAERPECQQRSSSSSSGSSSGSSSSGRRYYSTGGGRVVSRVGGAVIADMILPSRSTVSRSTVTSAGTYSRSSTSVSSPSRSSSSWSSPSTSSSTSTVSRGGFGSTSRSFSSGS